MAQLPTLGMQTPQQEMQAPITNLSQIEAQIERAKREQALAQALMTSGYVPNSGGLGALAQIVSAWRGKKLDKRAGESVAEAMARKFAEEQKLTEAQAAKAAAIEEAKYQRNRKDTVEDRNYTAEHRLPSYVQTDQGPMISTPGGLVPAHYAAQGGQVPPVATPAQPAGRSGADDQAMMVANTLVKAGIPPDQIEAIIGKLPGMAPGDANSPQPEEGQKYIQPEAGIIRPPGYSQQQAANARAEEQLQLARAAAARADKADARAERADQRAADAANKSGGDSKANHSAAAMAQDAINYAAATIGKSPEEVGKMTPEQIHAEMVKDPRALTSGPIAGSIWGMGRVANADLEAYANSAAGKKARLNNPTGPVTNADFEVARKSVFSPEKPASVNADLVFQALTWKRKGAPPKAAPMLPPAKPSGPKIIKYDAAGNRIP